MVMLFPKSFKICLNSRDEEPGFIDINSAMASFPPQMADKMVPIFDFDCNFGHNNSILGGKKQKGSGFEIVGSHNLDWQITEQKCV